MENQGGVNVGHPQRIGVNERTRSHVARGVVEIDGLLRVMVEGIYVERHPVVKHAEAATDRSSKRRQDVPYKAAARRHAEALGNLLRFGAHSQIDRKVLGDGPMILSE